MFSHKVSVIVPITLDREKYVERIKTIFNQQDYPNKELIWIPGEKETIGEKRNFGCMVSNGSIILHCDSDDIYSSSWITRSVNALIDSGAELTGLDTAFFLNSIPEAEISDLYRYQYTGPDPMVIGATMCYYKKTWERVKFEHISKGEDHIFCKEVKNIASHDYTDGFAAVLHGGNTASQDQMIYMRKSTKNERNEHLSLLNLLSQYGYDNVT